MHDGSEPAFTIRTAVAVDLPAQRRVYRTASLSNAGDAPMLLARPEFLVFVGGESRRAGPESRLRGQAATARSWGS